MNSVVVENIILTGEWVYDADAFERAKKARLLPDDVWGLIKSYAVPLNKCALCSKVCERTFCLPRFFYSTRVWRLEDALLTKGLRDRREKLTYDDVVVEKNFQSMRVCYGCSGEICKVDRSELSFSYTNNISAYNICYIYMTISEVFGFYIEKHATRAYQSKGSLTRLKNKLSKELVENMNPDKFSRLLDILYSCWFDYVKDQKEKNKKKYGEGKVDRFNAEIDELIVLDNENRIAEFYKEKYLKLIAKGFTGGFIDVETFINLTREYQITRLRSEEYHIEKLKKLEEQEWADNMIRFEGEEYCGGEETWEEWKDRVIYGVGDKVWYKK